MEPIKILSKEITPKYALFRSCQFPPMFNPLGQNGTQNESHSVGGDAGKNPVKLKSHKSFKGCGQSRRKTLISCEGGSKPIGTQSQNGVNNLVELIHDQEKNKLSMGENCKPQATIIKDNFSGKFAPVFLQQVRLYHKKTDASSESVTPVMTSRVLNKEALLNHHIQRNASHFSIFDPAMTAINLSALQPSRAGFNVRKLIAKSYKENWSWGLPPEIIQVRTEGPGINDNLIDFIGQKMRIQSDIKRKFGPLEETATLKIRSLMNKAKAMNIEAEKQRIALATPPPDYKEKRLYRTVSNMVFPDNKGNSPTKTLLDHKPSQRKRSQTVSGSFTTKSIGSEMTNSNKREPAEDSPLTAYQPSASYRDVFYNIFNKTRQKPSLVNTLSVFNRPAPSETIKAAPKAANKSTLSNFGAFMSARGRSEKLLESEQKKSQTNISRPSMKDVPRSPFEKVKDTLFSKSAKASFSTTPKTKGKIRKPVSEKKENAKGFSTSTKQKKAAKGRVVKPYIRTIKYQKRDKFSRNVVKSQDTNLLKAAYSMQSVVKGKRLANKEPKFTQNTSKLNHKPVTRSYFSYCQAKSNKAQYNALKNRFLKEKSEKESKKAVLPKSSIGMRNVHTKNYTIFEPVQETIYNEFLNLCESSNQRGEGVRRSQQSLEENCRCSLNEKKVVEKKKGLVCRLAAMFNIGCGRDTNCPHRGCTKCGKS